MVYYQTNPLPNWGPAARARTVKAGSGSEATVHAVPATPVQAQTDVSAEAKLEALGAAEAPKRKADVADVQSAAKKAKVEDEGGADEEEAMNMI